MQAQGVQAEGAQAQGVQAEGAQAQDGGFPGGPAVTDLLRSYANHIAPLVWDRPNQNLTSTQLVVGRMFISWPVTLQQVARRGILSRSRAGSPI